MGTASLPTLGRPLTSWALASSWYEHRTELQDPYGVPNSMTSQGDCPQDGNKVPGSGPASSFHTQGY